MIFFTGDTHNVVSRFSDINFPLGTLLKRNDYIIIAGDFGIPWSGNDQDNQKLDWLNNRNFTTLFIDGNHENFSLINQYPLEEWNGGKIHRLRPNVIHLMRGQIFVLGDKKVFTFGGSNSIDKEYRQIGLSWWPEEMPCDEEYDEGMINLKKYNNEVDYIVTHNLPNSLLDELSKYVPWNPTYNKLSSYLETIYNTVSYKKWYIGHYHAEKILTNKDILIYKNIKEANL